MPVVPATTAERTYETLSLIDVGGVSGNHMTIFVHPNGLCVVCMSPSHPLASLPDPASSLRLDWPPDGPAAAAAVQGKHKRGAVILRADTSICTASASASPHAPHVPSASFPMLACVKGKLLEVNERLQSEPSLLASVPTGAGFLAIVMPRDDELLELRSRAASTKPPVSNH